MLCSDGLSGVVSRSTIKQTLQEVEDPGDCADTLVSLALAAGAPDNVTCIIGDVVDLDASPADRAKAPANQIVGSAARDRKRPSLGSESSAGRAAKLAAGPVEEEEEEERVHRLARWRAWLLPVAALVAVVLGLWGAYAWTQTQYYVGVDGDQVAIFRGIPEDLGPLTLDAVVETTDLDVSDLRPFERDRVAGGLRTSSLDDARDIVESLRDGP